MQMRPMWRSVLENLVTCLESNCSTSDSFSFVRSNTSALQLLNICRLYIIPELKERAIFVLYSSTVDKTISFETLEICEVSFIPKKSYVLQFVGSLIAGTRSQTVIALLAGYFSPHVSEWDRVELVFCDVSGVGGIRYLFRLI